MFKQTNSIYPPNESFYYYYYYYYYYYFKIFDIPKNIYNPLEGHLNA